MFQPLSRARPVLAAPLLVLALVATSSAQDFKAAFSEPVGTGPGALATADLYGNGRMDIVTANTLSNDISVLINGTTGSSPVFLSAVNFPSGGLGAADVALGDLDGDGYPDAVVADRDSDTVSVLFGDGVGGFLAATTYPTGDAPVAVALGDTNGDGYLDIAVAEEGTSFTPGGVRVLENDGAGTFSGPPVILNTVGAFSDVAVGDFDSVNGLDVIALDAGALSPASDPLAQVFLNDGSGTFLSTTVWLQDFEVDKSGWDVFNPVFHTERVATGTNGVSSFSGAWHAECLLQDNAATDWGGYGAVFPPGGYKTSIRVYLDAAVSAANPGLQFDFSSAISDTNGLHRRDFIFHVGAAGDGSGEWDAAVSNNSPGNPIGTGTVHFSGTGWFRLEHIFRNDGGVLAVDFRIYDPSGTLVPGTDGPDWTRSDPSDTIGPGGIVGGNRYGWFSNQEFPFIAFDDSVKEIYDTTPAAFNAGSNPRGLAVADLDQDGNLDVLVADAGDIQNPGALVVLPGDGAGGFGAAVTYQAGLVGPVAVAAADLGEDGDMDVVLADAGADKVAFLLDYPTGFGSAAFLSSGVLPVDVALVELDLDYTVDVVTADIGSDEVTIHEANPIALVQLYGTGCPGTSGIPVISATGLPTLGNNSFSVDVSSARPFSSAFLVAGTAAANIPLGGGCELLVGGHTRIFLTFTDLFGTASIGIPVPNLATFEGRNYYFQWAIFDPLGTALGQYALSEGMRLKLGH